MEMFASFVYLVICAIACFFASLVAAHKNRKMSVISFSLLMMLFFGILLFAAAPYVYGYGHITQKIEPLDSRLKSGVVYTTDTSIKVGEKNYVVLLKEFPSSNQFALRVEKLPPETFILVDGQPVAVYNPATKPSTP